MVSCKDDDTTKPDTYMSISEKFMQGEISEDNLWSGITDWLSRKLKNTGNQSNHMSIFKRRENEVY